MMIQAEISQYSNGVQFRRADLHVHSYGDAGSYDVTDLSMTPEEIVDTAVAENLQVAAITDHNITGNVRRALKHAEGKKILVVPGIELSTHHREDPGFVMESMKQLRGDMGQFRDRVNDISPVGIIVESIARACRHYMNTTSHQASLRELEYSLGAVRKVIGINIGDLVKLYGLPMSAQLSSIVPQ
jgi:hypothetical protein